MNRRYDPDEDAPKRHLAVPGEGGLRGCERVLCSGEGGVGTFEAHVRNRRCAGEAVNILGGHHDEVARRPQLAGVPLPGGRVFVQDTRPCAREAAFLGDAECAKSLTYFDTPRRMQEAEAVPPVILADLLDRAFVVDWDGRYLSLVTRGLSPSRPAS